MFDRIRDRRVLIYVIFLIFFIALVVRLSQLTIMNGDEYRDQSVNKRLKKIPLIAKRGEVYDRNGVLLAGNMPAFTVHLINNEINSKEFNEVAIKIIDILEENDEKYLDFPIVYDDGSFHFKGDKEKSEWLIRNDFSVFASTEEVYKDIREREQISEELDKYSAQRILLLKGINLPISVRLMKFSYEIDKDNFLSYYGIDTKTSAKVAFQELRNYFRIAEDITDEDAYKILILKHAIREKGYLKYEPIKIANNISKETAVLIDELSMELPGINIEVEPIRHYEYGELSSHILGYLGKISSDREIAKYVDEHDYFKSDLIGKVGIEGEYELDLRGENGYKYIEVDVYGSLIREINNEIPGISNLMPKSGGDIELTIDIELQAAVKEYLVRALEAIRTGGVYESPWGDHQYPKAFEKAETGAAVVVNVNNGEILAMVSYPDYDLNLFSTGISIDDWNSLRPDNPRNPLAPRPMVNMATMTAVQPGSTFKMITGYAALEEGLDPDLKLYDNGFIETKDGRTFGCWIWNNLRGKHGKVSLLSAIEQSCNYYFYDVSNGYDYYKDEPLNIDMNAAKLIDYAKVFGLDDPTGIEISETVKGVPNPDRKKENLLSLLRKKLRLIAKDYFPEDIVSDSDKLEAVIDKIIELGDTNPSRGVLIRKLMEFGADPEWTVTENLADLIKYSYFNQMKWFEGDTFNLSIGQGDHAYTPIQMARYIASIANGGYLYELNLVKSVDGKAVFKNEPTFINQNGNIDYLKEGMYLVAHGSRGTSRKVFADFPLEVGAKTGTAEKEGKLPPENEEKYIEEYLELIAPGVDFEELEIEAIKILRYRNEEIADYEKERNETSDEEVIKSLDLKIRNLILSGYLNKSSAMREALKIMTDYELDDEKIDEYKDDYDNFTWFVSYAPFENSEIAVAIMIPQGGSGGNAAPIVKDIYGKYFDLPIPVVEEDE